MSISPRRIARIFFVLSLAQLVMGCAVSAEDIDHWQRTQKGPGKIVAVLLSDDYATELRVDAALALVEMERSDVIGVEQLDLAVDRLAKSDPEGLAAIAAGAEPRLAALLADSAPAPEGEAAQGEAAEGAEGSDTPKVSPLAVRAKDAAFHLAEQAPAATRAKLGEAMLTWVSNDYARRATAGDVSGEQLAAAFGDQGARMLVRSLNARLPNELLPRLVEKVAEIGSAETKAAAAARLVEIENEMNGPAYLAWLEGQIETRMAREDREPDAEHLELTAKLTRARFINNGVLPAMKHLAGEDVVAERLLKLAETPPPAGLEGELLEVHEERRTRALAALEGVAKPAQSQRLLALALSDAVPLPTRDLAFNRLADTKDASVAAALVPLIEATASATATREDAEKTRLLRVKAAELVLRLEGAAGYERLVRYLPRGSTAAFEPDELTVYAGQLAAMDSPPASLRDDLDSFLWWRRVVAMLYLEKAGELSDAHLLEELMAVRMPTVGEGWARRDPPQDTVGKVAAAAVKSLRERLARADAADEQAKER